MISAKIGWVVGSWSCRYAQDFSTEANVVQAWSNSVFSTAARWDMYSAKDSLSQRSFHQRMVTRSPNHMCASSCSTVMARRSTWASVTLPRKT